MRGRKRFATILIMSNTYKVIASAYDANDAVAVERACNGRKRLIVMDNAGGNWRTVHSYSVPMSRNRAAGIVNSFVRYTEQVSIDRVIEAACQEALRG